MGKGATGKNDADCPTRKCTHGVIIMVHSFEILNVIWRTVKAFRSYDVDFIFLQKFVQSMFRADEWYMQWVNTRS